MKTETMLVALIALLVVLAGVQAYQITAVAQAIASGAVVAGGSVVQASAPKASVLSQLPTQVGGCG